MTSRRRRRQRTFTAQLRTTANCGFAWQARALLIHLLSAYLNQLIIGGSNNRACAGQRCSGAGGGARGALLARRRSSPTRCPAGAAGGAPAPGPRPASRQHADSLRAPAATVSAHHTPIGRQRAALISSISAGAVCVILSSRRDVII